MAVSSANRVGEPAALTSEQAQHVGEAVAVYLDGGPWTARCPRRSWT